MAAIKGWFTMNGIHIPVMEGQSKAEAASKYMNSKHGKIVAKLSSKKYTKQKGLTDKDKNIIDNWVQNGNDISSDMQSRLQTIIKNNATVSGKVNLIRRVTTPELGTSIKEIKNNPDNLIGKTITSKGFLATSSKEGGADNFVGIDLKINNVKNTKGLDINSIKGLSLSTANRRSAEQEVLFNKGTKYKITKVNLFRDKSGDVYDYTIEADIIG